MFHRPPFKHHRFPRDIIFCAIRWYLRYPLSCQDVVDLLAERGILVDRSTVSQWVQKFGPETAERADKAPTYRRVIREINHRYDPHFDSIRHIDRKWRINPVDQTRPHPSQAIRRQRRDYIHRPPVRFHNALPKTATGKIQRFALCELNK